MANANALCPFIQPDFHLETVLHGLFSDSRSGTSLYQMRMRSGVSVEEAGSMTASIRGAGGVLNPPSADPSHLGSALDVATWWVFSGLRSTLKTGWRS